MTLLPVVMLLFHAGANIYIYGICYYEILAAGTSKSFTCAVLTIGIADILFVFNWYDFTFIIGDLKMSFNEPQNHFWESMVFR